jgi:excisionase family DNA binding protein
MSFNKSQQIEQYLTVAEVATLLNVHEMTVRQWYVKKKLRVQRVGRKAVRISRVDLDDFLNDSNNPMKTEPRKRK